MPNRDPLRSASEAAFNGALSRAFGRAGAVLWTQTMGRSLIRALPLPAGPRVIAIGGATLGGSGKTPLAMACAEHLATMGARATIVGHAYRAKPGRARIVSPSDRLEDVGDEALLAARAFAGRAAATVAATRNDPRGRPCPRIVVAPTRAEAMAFAAPESDVLILDGVAQTAPTRASLALLALDAEHPWGRTGALPPLGDLRAARTALVGACDALVSIHDGAVQHAGKNHHDRENRDHAAPQTAQTRSHLASRGVPEQEPWITEDPLRHVERNGPEPIQDERIPHGGKDVFAARSESRGAWDASGALQTWENLRSVRVGLLTALARPERVIAALARRGIHPRVALIGRDHGPISAGAAVHEREGRAPRVDLWLATPKCALHAERVRLALPLATLDHSVVLPPRLCACLAHVLRTSSSRAVP